MTIRCLQLHYAVAGKTLLSQIDTKFKSAHVTVLLGKNGAGKSTLLKFLSKELVSDRVEFNGQNLQFWDYAELAKSRAVLPQQQNLMFSMTVRELIALGLQVQSDLNTQQGEAVMAELLQLCDLQNLANRDLMTLSGGELQRAQVARVLAQIWPAEGSLLAPSVKVNPKLLVGKWLFLDEWSNALDLHHQQHFICLFRQLTSLGLGIISVLHDLNLAAQLADEIKILRDGELVVEGSVADVMQEEKLMQTLDLKVSLYQRQDDNYALLLR